MKTFNIIYLLSVIIISCDIAPMGEGKKGDSIDEIIIHFEKALTSNSNELVKHDIDQSYKDSIYAFLKNNKSLIVKGKYKHLRISDDIIYYEINRPKYSVTSGYFKNSNKKVDSILKLYKPGDSLIAYGRIKPKSVDAISSINKNYTSNKPNFFMEIDSVELVKRYKY